MKKKLTITIAEEVYAGLYRKVGRRRISRFLEALARPHVLDAEPGAIDLSIAADEVREEWAENRTKTTIDLENGLVAAARQRAAEEGTSLERLVARGLRRELEAGATGATGEGRSLLLPVVDGGLPPELDVADRVAMHEWLRTHP
jgi:hypothetical protein